jgi:16S rRNA (guanine527-N7)-methyltransferase
MDKHSEQRQMLDKGARQLGASLSRQQAEQLLGLLSLLVRWSKAFNLTAVRDPLRMVPYHVLDSLAVAPFLRGERLLDVGTGAGFPGLPLAICNPQRHFVLLDSNGKKVRFVRQAVMELGLANVEVEQARIEAYQSTLKFDTIMCRAFASLPTILGLTEPLLGRPGYLLALKSRKVDVELEQLPDAPGRMMLHRLQIPYLNGDRSVVEIERS